MNIPTKYNEGESVQFIHEGKRQTGKIYGIFVKVKDDVIYISYHVSLGAKRGNSVTVIEKPEDTLFSKYEIVEEQKRQEKS